MAADRDAAGRRLPVLADRGHEGTRRGPPRKRNSKVQPSQVCRKKPKRKRPHGDVYDTRAYARAIARCCEEAGVTHWHPNQLRHTHATEVRKRYGLEAAR